MEKYGAKSMVRPHEPLVVHYGQKQAAVGSHSKAVAEEQAHPVFEAVSLAVEARLDQLGLERCGGEGCGVNCGGSG